MSADTRLTEVAPGRWRLQGRLDFGTVTALAAAGERLLKEAGRPGSGPLVVDLSGVDSANSAGLALLLEWLGVARARGIHLSYANVPDSLQRIAAFSNLQDSLPLVA